MRPIYARVTVCGLPAGRFKLGIEFVDWQHLGHRCFHGAGGVGVSFGMLPFYHYWLRANRSGNGRGAC